MTCGRWRSRDPSSMGESGMMVCELDSVSSVAGRPVKEGELDGGRVPLEWAPNFAAAALKVGGVEMVEEEVVVALEEDEEDDDDDDGIEEEEDGVVVEEDGSWRSEEVGWRGSTKR